MLQERQDKEFRNKDLEKGKETRHSQLRSCLPRGKREHQNERDQENQEYLALLCIMIMSNLPNIFRGP